MWGEPGFINSIVVHYLLISVCPRHGAPEVLYLNVACCNIPDYCNTAKDECTRLGHGGVCLFNACLHGCSSLLSVWLLLS